MTGIELFNIDTELFLVGFFLFFAIVQLIFIWGFFSHFAFAKRKKSTTLSTYCPPISIVICAKNELRFLKKNIPILLQQDYPCFEIVIVDDNSDDNITEGLKELIYNDSRINLIHISTNFEIHYGKKLALAMGIKCSKYDIVLLTDADCYPKSNTWIREMVAAHSNQHQIVLGYGAYEQKNGIIDKLIRFDTLHTAIQYFSFALMKKPYMGVGRNLLYDKSLYNNNYGYLNTYRTISGDDDLFINKVSNQYNTTCVFQPAAHTISLQRDINFIQWLKQKKRHLSASKYYKKKNKYVLGLYWISNFFFYFFLIFLTLASFLLYKNMKLVLIIISVYLIISLSKFIIFAKAGNKLEEKKLIRYTFVLDIFFAMLMPLLQLVLLIKKQERWN